LSIQNIISYFAMIFITTLYNHIMKRFLRKALIFAAIIGLASCLKNYEYTVIFRCDGGEPIPQVQSVKNGNKLTQPPSMTKMNYTFGAWYIDADYTVEWNFAKDVVTRNMRLYAKWIENDHEHEFGAWVVGDGQRTQTCLLCDFTIFESLAFVPIGSSASYEVSIGTFTGTEIVIPPLHNGQPVTDIASYAFARSNISSITIPSSITHIYVGAFAACKELTSITIPSSVTYMSASVFEGWTKFQTIRIQTHKTAPEGWSEGWLWGSNAAVEWGVD